MPVMYKRNHPPLSFDDQRGAAAIWNEIALVCGVEYAFIGRFAIELMRKGQPVDFIQILIHREALAALFDNTYLNSDVVVRGSRGWMIHIGDNKYVALEFVITGTNNYPSTFVPPYGSPAHDIPNCPSGPPNIFHLDLGFKSQSVCVPVLSPDYMLYEKIFNLDTITEYQRCLDEIDSLLIYAYQFGRSISRDLRGPLIPIVQKHLLGVSRRKSVWAYLGLELPFILPDAVNLAAWGSRRSDMIYVNRDLTTIEKPEIGVWNCDSPENKAPTITAFREYPIYSHMWCPASEQICNAILFWNELALEIGIRYCLVGQVAAWLMGYNGGVYDIGILMSDDGLERLQRFAFEDMKKPIGRKLAITPTNRHILVTYPDSLYGMAFQIFTTGKKGYPKTIDATQTVTIPTTDRLGRTVHILHMDMLLAQVLSEIDGCEREEHMYANTGERQDECIKIETLKSLATFWISLVLASLLPNFYSYGV